ncbi:MAG TPA: hypothetical protein VNU48_01790 [Burkholderiaceae bacterium]|nr:hypothetical protein [Burkholderiaceae bacterium]
MFGQNIREQAAQWPTPAQRDGDSRRGATSPDSDAWKNKVGRGAVNAAGMLSDDLKSSAVAWPTPRARDHKGGGTAVTRPDGKSRMDMLDWRAEAFSRQVLPTPVGQESSPSTPNSPRHLNPVFGAWLMGWPSTWVIAEPHASSALATESWRRALQRQLSSLLGEPACSPLGLP